MLLRLIQLFHLAVTLYMFACLFYMIYCHVYGRQTRWLAIAYLSVLVETAVFFAYGWVCPFMDVYAGFLATMNTALSLPGCH
jgi:hypothetical protein